MRMAKAKLPDAAQRKEGAIGKCGATHEQAPSLLQGYFSKLQQTHGNKTVQQLLHAHLLQAKLTINQPGDEYEQEADRLADQVTRMLDTSSIEPVTASQAEGQAIQRGSSSCERLETDASSEVETRIEQARSNGRGLDSGVRFLMESTFGADFSDVRIHADFAADILNREVNAVAFTTGQDIFFRQGYAPENSAGRQLLAHELAHVVQQRGAVARATKAQRLCAECEEERERVHRKPAPENRWEMRPKEDIEIRQSSEKIGPIIQRTCGAGLGEPRRACKASSAEPSGEVFLFETSCDDLKSGEAAHAALFLSGLPAGTTVNVHGFASVDGSREFNEKLSCHRANKLASVLSSGPTAVSISDILFHGPVPGPARYRRSAIAEPISTAPGAQTAASDAAADGGGGGGGAASCAAKSECGPDFCSPMASVAAAKADRHSKAGILLSGIATVVSPRVVPVWLTHIAGGSSPQDFTSKFGADFAADSETERAAKFLADQLRADLEIRPVTFPTGSPKVTVDIAKRIPSAIKRLGTAFDSARMNFSGVGSIPGNLAGDIGKDQTTCKVGAMPSPFDDDRTAKGNAEVAQNSDGTMTVKTDIRFTVQDTVDLCPGDCGAPAEQIATIPFSRWEATGISGDVPFTVEFDGPQQTVVARPSAPTPATEPAEGRR